MQVLQVRDVLLQRLDLHHARLAACALAEVVEDVLAGEALGVDRLPGDDVGAREGRCGAPTATVPATRGVAFDLPPNMKLAPMSATTSEQEDADPRRRFWRAASVALGLLTGGFDVAGGAVRPPRLLAHDVWLLLARA